MYWKAVLLVFVTNCCHVRGDFTLQILHTNDMHSYFAGIDDHGSPCSHSHTETRRCYGGFARIREAALQAKREALRQNVPSIFLNAGDTFQGTPYYYFYKWRVAAALVNSLEFDVMCLGNHEFDDGIDNLVQYLANLKTPMVTANLNKTSERRLNETNVKDSIVLNVNGQKIGIVGYLTPSTMMSSDTEKLLIFNEIPYVRAEAKRLKSMGIKLVIGLGHSGLTMDEKIAKEVDEIDIIVGGHSHSLLYTPNHETPTNEIVDESYPYWITQRSGKRVPIVQSSAFTKYFGKLTVTLDDQGRVIAAHGNSYLLDAKYRKNTEVERQIDFWTEQLKKDENTIIGSTSVSLKKADFKKNNFESNLANLILDAYFETGVSLSKRLNHSQWVEYSLALCHSGAIRSEIDYSEKQGNISTADIITVLPYRHRLAQCQISGENIRRAIELSVTDSELQKNGIQHFLYFSGLKVTYDLRKPQTKRATSIMVLCTKCHVPKFEPLNDARTYQILLNYFLLKGGDGFSLFKTSCKNVKLLEITDADALMNYIRKREIVYPMLDGRLMVVGFGNSSTAVISNISIYSLLLALVVMLHNSCKVYIE